jgi:hypothetical protein
LTAEVHPEEMKMKRRIPLPISSPSSTAIPAGPADIEKCVCELPASQFVVKKEGVSLLYRV